MVCCPRGARGFKKGIIPEVEGNHLDSFRQRVETIVNRKGEERLHAFENVVQARTRKEQYCDTSTRRQDIC